MTRRYAVYYMPPAGPLAAFGAQWLGWDAEGARDVAQPDVPEIAALTEAPRKYGFHGTLKPPFRLVSGRNRDDLHDAIVALGARTAPARAGALALTRIGRFLALTPTGDTGGIARVAAACVQDLDVLRAPLTADEMARRQRPNLSHREKVLLAHWGYPYVLDRFRFHLTLTGPVRGPRIETVTARVEALLPPLCEEFLLTEICLCGEREDGRFELLERVPLRG